MKQSKPYMAPWLLFYPFALGFAAIYTAVARPTTGSCMTVGCLVGATAFLVLVQFGILRLPAVSAFHDKIAKESSGDALLLSLLLDVHYTFWFGLAVLGLLVALVAQGVYLGRGAGR